MASIIKTSSDIRKSYNSIAEICRASKAPVFLTKNGEGDTVLTDIETYGKREHDLDLREKLLAEAQRILDAERALLDGAEGNSVDEFEKKMQNAIRRGSGESVKDGA